MKFFLSLSSKLSFYLDHSSAQPNALFLAIYSGIIQRHSPSIKEAKL